MEENIVLYHHGVKGQKWGVRRFQNKDGSLTRLGKKRLNVNDKDRVKKAKKQVKEQKEKETIEQRRAKLLKSSDAQELYKNRHLLTNAEINDRLQRIEIEKKLGAEAEKSKVTGNQKIKKIIDNVKGAADNIEAVYQITQMPFAKALMKKFKGEEPEETFDTNKMLEDIDTLSDAKLGKLATRMKNTKEIQESLVAINKAKNGGDDGWGGYKTLTDAWDHIDELPPNVQKQVAEAVKTRGEAASKYTNFATGKQDQGNTQTDTKPSSTSSRKTYSISKDQLNRLKNATQKARQSTERVTQADVERLRKAAQGTGIGSKEWNEYMNAMDKYNRQK